MSSCTRLTEWIGSYFGNPTTQETSSKESEESNILAVSPVESNPRVPVNETVFDHILRFIIEKYEFPDLIQILPSSRLISTSTSFSIDNELWKSVRDQFNQWNPVPAARFLPLNEGSAQEQVQAKIKHNSDATKENLQTCRDFEIFPEDIKELVRQDKILNFEEIEYLKAFRQARDTFVVWRELSNKIQGNFTYDYLQSGHARIAEAESFGEWIDGNIDNLTNLTNLHLHKQLTTLPTEICRLTNLTYLNLSGNKLTTLPTEIGNLTNLTYLNLSGNKLTTLPTEIGNLTNLTELDLSGNKLTTLPTEIGNFMNLTTLYLSDNNLTTLPPEMIEFLRNIPYLDDQSLISQPRCTIL